MRFILVSEKANGDHGDYGLTLYAAPKPNRRETGLCKHSIYNRDINLPKFTPWFEGYREGRGL